LLLLTFTNKATSIFRWGISLLESSRLGLSLGVSLELSLGSLFFFVTHNYYFFVFGFATEGFLGGASAAFNFSMLLLEGFGVCFGVCFFALIFKCFGL
jgi:hypothetical protein